MIRYREVSALCFANKVLGNMFVSINLPAITVESHMKLTLFILCKLSQIMLSRLIKVASCKTLSSLIICLVLWVLLLLCLTKSSTAYMYNPVDNTSVVT